MLCASLNPGNAGFSNQLVPFVVLLLLGTSHGFQNGSRQGSRPSAHLNFYRGRQRVMWCDRDPSVCLDREKNPWGGTTCCFRKFCKDTRSDSSHCGACGLACGYGRACCDGKCVDVQNDPYHCGSCFEECPGETKCSFAMCDYGG
ncbi:hypothetical protein RHMOL_Rhmol04G0359000 [Rhododendron molle]|uniref:Uncharacterized protein n=1 Tax=Rhododendron molle TaxID=49168 RepID=A0ACC0PA83_RHOML|nr:hypothetical protein RHMOL_Rhmol04G0359000 [Rhododendron molle]